ncbi:MAG: protein kinase, partial [Chloroflexota bacterium]|nr:protein kinase [Chloroflexota bacterium]
AVKMLREPYASDKAFRSRFLAEARAIAKLDHPHIVRIYDLGIDHEHPYLVMELVVGQSLKARIHQEAPFPIPEVLRIGEQICAGVGVAHRAGIVHCDLKPQNVLITTEGTIKVADFGIARALQAEHETAEKSQLVWGSPHYISPEQAAGEQPTPASDVYSIGVILYEMLAGVPPFHAEDDAELIRKHLQEAPAPPSSFNPQVPPKLEWLVGKVLSKEKSRRYRNAEQFGRALEQYRRHGEEQTVAHPAATPMAPQATNTLPRPPAMTQPGPEKAAKSGPDWLLWLLLGIATIAVLGLIPLWGYVYQVYNESGMPLGGITSEEIATATPAGELVSVPRLIGLSAVDAEALANSYQLQFAIQHEDEGSDALPGTILSQDPQPGSRVPVSSTLQVVTAKGQRFPLQDVLGLQLEDVVAPLKALGLIIKTEKAWSTKPVDEILAQLPAPESEVQTGSTITLTVSGGKEQRLPLQVNFNNQISLEEALVPQYTFKPGDSVPVTLYWRALQPLHENYVVFTHLTTSATANPAAQHDSEPGNGTNPTTGWIPGEIIIDPHQVTIPQGTPSGSYQLRVGLYTAEGRLKIIDSGHTQVAAGSVFIVNVEVRP